MSENKKKIFIIISILVGLAIAVILFLLFKSKNVGPTTDVDQTVQNQEEQTELIPASPISINNNQPTVVKTPPAELYPEQLAKMFVERLLSYSNQINNQHIEDMLPFATTDMAKWMEKQRVKFSSDYQGVNTVVISSSIKELKETTAVVEMGIRQAFEGVKSEVVYKTGRVELVKSGDSWKVDGLYWDK